MTAEEVATKALNEIANSDAIFDWNEQEDEIMMNIIKKHLTDFARLKCKEQREICALHAADMVKNGFSAYAIEKYVKQWVEPEL